MQNGVSEGKASEVGTHKGLASPRDRAAALRVGWGVCHEKLSEACPPSKVDLIAEE